MGVDGMTSAARAAAQGGARDGSASTIGVAPAAVHVLERPVLGSSLPSYSVPSPSHTPATPATIIAIVTSIGRVATAGGVSLLGDCAREACRPWGVTHARGQRRSCRGPRGHPLGGRGVVGGAPLASGTATMRSRILQRRTEVPSRQGCTSSIPQARSADSALPKCHVGTLHKLGRVLGGGRGAVGPRVEPATTPWTVAAWPPARWKHRRTTAASLGDWEARAKMEWDLLTRASCSGSGGGPTAAGDRLDQTGIVMVPRPSVAKSGGGDGGRRGNCGERHGGE